MELHQLGAFPFLALRIMVKSVRLITTPIVAKRLIKIEKLSAAIGGHAARPVQSVVAWFTKNSSISFKTKIPTDITAKIATIV